MKMNHTADFREPGLRPVQRVVDGQEVLLRQLVDPLDQQPLVASGFKGRSGDVEPKPHMRVGGRSLWTLHSTCRMAIR